MASRRQIADDIRAQIGTMPNLSDVAKYLGMDPKTARTWLSDVESFRLGRKRCYLPADLARKIESVRIQPEI